MEVEISGTNCVTLTISEPPSKEYVDESTSSLDNVMTMKEKNNRSNHRSIALKPLTHLKRGRTRMGERIVRELSRMATLSGRLSTKTPPMQMKDIYEIQLEELQKIEDWMKTLSWK